MGTGATRLAEVTLGTTAWRISMGRRQVIEGANAGPKGGFVSIERKFMRVLGVTKMTVLLAFAIAGCNMDRIRACATQGGLRAELEKEDAVSIDVGEALELSLGVAWGDGTSTDTITMQETGQLVP